MLQDRAPTNIIGAALLAALSLACFGGAVFDADAEIGARSSPASSVTLSRCPIKPDSVNREGDR